MFERRLKIFLAVVTLVAFVLVVRAAQVQVVERRQWQDRAAETMKRSQLVETFRGRIVDCRGRPVAVDSPCVDAVVDYRVIDRQLDENWVLELARKRLRSRPGTNYLAEKPEAQKRLREAEIAAVKADLESMWATLARVSGKPREEIDQTRNAIVNRVQMRRRFIWYRNYELARQRHAEKQRLEPTPAWQRWLIGETQDAPELNDFSVTVAEETEPHVVLRNISKDAQVELARRIERFPGLALRGSTYRYYPYGSAGCHLVGRLSKVDKEDLKNDPNVGVDELRQYLPNDLIGRSGVELLAEPLLRGTRGRIDRVDGEEVGSYGYEPGKDVRLTIDIELQQEIQRMFARVEVRDAQNKVVRSLPMHGAVVVIDVATGGVRALASFPDFDPNTFDDDFARLSRDDNLDKPLLNRATQSQLEPGSTVKPMVGLGAIASGLITTEETIECTGYLMINGKPQRNGRCWVASKFHDKLCPNGAGCPLKHRGCPSVAHHNLGALPHPSGYLVYSEALERSCNVYFETLADRLGLDGLSAWYGKFGLGRPTGIGISEYPGRLPSSYVGAQKAFATWSAGIGQGPVAATPLQMANVVATIARDGVWVRPTLLDAPGFTNPEIEKLGPARVSLGLPLDAVRAAKEGMVRVVNSKAGTGTFIRRDDVLLAAKTGTAQAAALSVVLRDEKGAPLLDENGRVRRELLELSTPEHPNARVPWYLGTGADNQERNHAWFTGFAPARNPKIAFAIMLEYGGSGGNTAASVAKGVIEACVERGYLPLDTMPLTPATMPTAAVEGEELLRGVR
jgi:penicillin-binding protein 2